jgi:hypothetical protein
MLDMNKIKEQMGFLTDKELPEFAQKFPDAKILVRCNMGRFICAADSTEHFVKVVEASKLDYVRDVSLTSDEFRKHFPGAGVY